MIPLHHRRGHARHRDRQHGQSLAIFAIMALVLFAVVGMAVDGGYSYFISDKLERGAVAAALAGVPDMPNLSGPLPNDATTAATAAATLNGWKAPGTTNVSISVLPVPNGATGTDYQNRLSVTISADVPVFFMKLLGFGAHRESRTAVAEYLPPITFGQPGGQLGSDLNSLGTPSTNPDGSANKNAYFMRSEGWASDRGEGDPYGPNPLDPAGSANASLPPYSDTHDLNAVTEPPSQPLGGLPARGGQSYEIYVPPGLVTTLQVYNPAFAPDNGVTNGLGYNYHEDDGDFVETGGGCIQRGTGTVTAACAGPTNVQQWPTMSYTVYKSPTPFDHTKDVWLSNVQVNSIDASANNPATCAPPPPAPPTNTCTYIIPGVAGGPLPVSQLGALYHAWMSITKAPAGAAYTPLVTATYPLNKTAPSLRGAAVTGTTYRLRVDQLDDNSVDPAINGRTAINQNSQAHKAYAVQASGCTTCTVAALNDITLFTPVQAGTFSIPLVSIPPDYAGRTFSLFIYDPGDVGGSSNVLTLLQPALAGASTTAADTTDGIWESNASSQFGPGTSNSIYTNQVAGGPAGASIQTRVSSRSIYNGRWLRFDVAVPSDYATKDVDPADASTWYWSLQYSTNGTATDTISANLGFAGAPVHIVSG